MSFGNNLPLRPVEIVMVVCPTCRGDQGYYIDVDVFVACGECNGSGEVESVVEELEIEEAPSIDWSGYTLISAPVAAYIDNDEVAPRKPPKRSEPHAIPRHPIKAAVRRPAPPNGRVGLPRQRQEPHRGRGGSVVDHEPTGHDCGEDGADLDASGASGSE